MKKREEAQKVVANRTKWTFWIVLIILALLILLYIQFTYNSNIGLGIVLKSPGITGNPAAPSGGDDAGLGGDGGGEVESGTSGTENAPATTSSGGDSGVQFAPTKTACEDGVDNDRDDWTDREDAGCWTDGQYDQQKNSENAGESEDEFECSDGIDNDGDEKADAQDTNCDSGRDDKEASQCQDGIDNDDDNLVDPEDNGCIDQVTGEYDPFLNDESIRTSQCQDGIDNDEDGFCDYLGAEVNPFICRNGAGDPECGNNPLWDSEFIAGGGGGADRDGDGVIEEKDNCWTVPNPNQEDTYGKQCSGGPYNEDPKCGDACEQPERQPPPRENPEREFGDREQPRQSPDGEERQPDQSFNYELKSGNNLNEGEYARIILTTKDTIQFKIDSRTYVIEIIEVGETTVTIKISTPSEELTRIINANSIDTIDIGEGRVLAIQVSGILDQEFTEITVALLGGVEEGSEGAPLESIFETVTQDEENKIDARKITEIGDSIREVPAIVKTTVLIIAIAILIIYLVSRTLASRRMLRAKTPPIHKTEKVKVKKK